VMSSLIMDRIVRIDLLRRLISSGRAALSNADAAAAGAASWSWLSMTAVFPSVGVYVRSSIASSSFLQGLYSLSLYLLPASAYGVGRSFSKQLRILRGLR
jgi:hypothetical protein